MREMLRLPLRTLYTLLAALLLFGCSRAPISKVEAAKSTPAGPPAKGDWIVQQISADPDTLNPTNVTDSMGQTIVSQIFEGLLKQNNVTLKLEPNLAESSEISPDQLTYTFHLRHDVKWQDGVPFTADDVKYTYDRIQDPKDDAAPIRSYFSTVKSCEVLDPYTVRFVTTQRYFKTLEVLGNFMLILPKHIYEKGGLDYNSNPFNRTPFGTGPYYAVRWDSGSQIVLKRNENYWGDKRYISRIVYRIIEEPYVAAQLIKKGELDVFDPVSPLQWTRELQGSRSMQNLKRIVYDFPAYSYLGFNLRLPLFQDVRVRHAIDLLIPRDRILAQIYLNQYGTKTSGYDPPSDPAYNHGIQPTPYDPKLAAQLLHEAGWSINPSNGLLYKQGHPLSFGVNYPAGSTSHEQVAELMQESFRQAGIDFKLQRLEWAQLLAKINDWNFESVLAGWATGFNDDPSQIWSSSEAKLKKSSNFVGYSNPAADKLITQAKLEYNDEKRAALYQQLQKVIFDDYPECFLFNPREILLVSNRYQNVTTFAPRPCFDITTWWAPTRLQRYH